MRILHTIPGRNWGGMEQRVLDQMRWLLAHGHETWLATPMDGESYRRASDAQLPVEAFTFDRPWAPGTLMGMRRLVKRLKPNVVDAHVTRDTKALMGALDLIALVRSRHITQPLNAGFGRRLQWRTIPDHVIAVAGCVRDMLVARGLVAPLCCSVVGEWADDRFFADATPSLRPALGLSADDIVIACVGMLRPDKGQDILLEAFARVTGSLPTARLLLIGAPTGESRAYAQGLETRAAGIGRVTFTGYRDDIPALLDASDLVVVPSRLDAQSRIVPQAFARRKPVITTRTGGLPELIEDGITGCLVAPEDTDALARAIVRIASDRALRERLASAGHDVARESLRLDTKMEETLAAYRSALTRAHFRSAKGPLATRKGYS
jgi:glycosyltransferase involved in cell wall biosynthesis